MFYCWILNLNEFRALWIAFVLRLWIRLTTPTFPGRSRAVWCLKIEYPKRLFWCAMLLCEFRIFIKGALWYVPTQKLFSESVQFITLFSVILAKSCVHIIWKVSCQSFDFDFLQKIFAGLSQNILILNRCMNFFWFFDFCNFVKGRPTWKNAWQFNALTG